MINKEGEMLLFFAQEPWRKYTFTELKQASKKKSNSYLAQTLQKSVNNNLLRREIMGKLPIYSLNVSSIKASVFAGFILENSAWNKKYIPYKDMEKLMLQIPTRDYIFLVAGSYAKGKQTQKSDIDCAILVDDAIEPKRVYAELAHACEMNIPRVHLYVFRHKEFLEMLLNKEANYGKEVALNNLVLHGGQSYIQLIAEAMSHGFTGKFAY
jgi:hypothetical protein